MTRAMDIALKGAARRHDWRLVVLVAGLLGPTSWLAHAEVQVGQPAPAMVATSLDGQRFDLPSLRGKVVLLSFWATWCVPCRKEMPLLDAFYRKHRDAGLVLLAVSVDRPRDREKVRAMMRRFGYPAAMLRDVQANGFDPPDGVPSTYVIARDGVVRDRLIAVDEALLADVVMPLLARPAAPSAVAK